MPSSNPHNLSAERARELFHYDPEGGRLSWRVDAGLRGQIPAGTEAGHIFGPPNCRYRQVGAGGKYYQTHRLIWLIMTGAWPPAEIDHIDGNGLNNRWDNLRAVTKSGNQRNARQRADNTSGATGVSMHKPSHRWQAYIYVNGTQIHLGLFGSLSAAIEARKAAERQYGYHPNHGR